MYVEWTSEEQKQLQLLAYRASTGRSSPDLEMLHCVDCEAKVIHKRPFASWIEVERWKEAQLRGEVTHEDYPYGDPVCCRCADKQARNLAASLVGQEIAEPWTRGDGQRQLNVIHDANSTRLRQVAEEHGPPHPPEEAAGDAQLVGSTSRRSPLEGFILGEMEYYNDRAQEALQRRRGEFEGRPWGG